VPLEAVSSGGGVTYVFKQTGGRQVRQEVVTGPMNDHEVVILHGLEENDRVLLAPPADPASVTLERLPENLRPVPADTAAPEPARDSTAPRRPEPPRTTAPPAGAGGAAAPARH